MAGVPLGRRSLLRLGGRTTLALVATALAGAACANPSTTPPTASGEPPRARPPAPGEVAPTPDGPIAPLEPTRPAPTSASSSGGAGLNPPSPIGGADPAPSTAVPSAAGVEEAGAPWAREWRDLILAAQREGRLSLLTWVGGGYRQTVQAFQRLFPGIAVDHVEDSSAESWLARVGRERRAGTYAWDIGMLHTDRALQDSAAQGMWAPLRPLLFHPEATRESAWRGGFDGRFVDADGKHCFAWSYSVFHVYAINTDLVAEGEIASVRDLLEPRWRGRMISLDPRLGTGLLTAAATARAWGDDILRPLFVDQRPVVVDGGPAVVAEPLARGQYPIARGVRPKALEPLRARGIGHQVRYLDLPDADFVPASSLLHFDRAPHAAAAQLFANWILTREGQATLAGGLQTNSARTDLPPYQRDEIGRTASDGSGPTYYEPDREANFAHTAATRARLRSLLG